MYYIVCKDMAHVALIVSGFGMDLPQKNQTKINASSVHFGENAEKFRHPLVMLPAMIPDNHWHIN